MVEARSSICPTLLSPSLRAVFCCFQGSLFFFNVFGAACGSVLSLGFLPIQALVSPENWKGKKGKHLRRVLAEAHDAAIILVNPTDPDKFLRVSAVISSMPLLC